MPKIKRNNKLIHYNRVVAYGCSFTVGEETADTFVRPGLTLDQIDDEKRSMGMEAWLFKYLTPNKANSPQRKREANSNSWANQLAAMLGVPCVKLTTYCPLEKPVPANTCPAKIEPATVLTNIVVLATPPLT